MKFFQIRFVPVDSIHRLGYNIGRKISRLSKAGRMAAKECV